MMQMCQSCSMPLMKEDDRGTNKDGSISDDYCMNCFVNGKFVGYQTVEEAIADSVNYAGHAGMTREEMLEYAKTNYPNLKRWKTRQH